MEDKVRLTTKTYDEISQLYANEFNKPSDHINDFLRLISNGGSILDAGCGPGTDSDYIQTKGYSVFGVDVSDKMVDLAQKKNPKVHFEKADIRELNFKIETFDGILASFSIIHIPKQDLLPTFLGFNKILKNGGVIYVSIQEGKSEEIIVDEPLKPDEKIFLNIISAEDLRKLLKDTGFEILNEFTRPPKNKEEFNFNEFIVIARKN